MFNKPEVPKQYKRLLEEELERAIEHLKGSTTDSEEYGKMLTSVERLHEMLDEEQMSASVSKDTWATIGANLLGILMIIKYESVNVIRTKAINFVPKLRP